MPDRYLSPYSTHSSHSSYSSTFMTEVKSLKNIDGAVGFIFSRCGITKDAENYCKIKGDCLVKKRSGWNQGS